MINSPVQQIKEKLDIVEFIRSYVPLQAAGKNFKAPCPFHKEKTPSFMVSPDRQTWHCFGSCAEGGDIFKFLMKYENIEFYEALKILAEKAGIELKRISPQEHKQFGLLFDINAMAKDFYKQQLSSSPEVLKYAAGRGLKKETIDEFELGFAPQSYDKLIVHLTGLGIDVRDIERAGLAFKTERGSYIDRFHGRLMFPICDNFGKPMAFSGRILPQYEKGDEGKYINSPETSIFNKSRTLYGFYRTKNEIKEQNAVILVEGQMDFLMAYQDGLRNVVATSGTALTLDHLKTLRRYADTLILSFDNDEAGLKAAERSIDLAAAADFNVKLLMLKDYKDPAEAAEKKPGHLAELAGKAISSMEFYFGHYLTEGKKEFIDIKKSLRAVLGKIRNLASPIERSHWLKQLADRTGVNENALIEEMMLLRSTELRADNFVNPLAKNKEGAEQDIVSTRREMLAEALLGIILTKEGLKERVGEFAEYFPGDYALILENLRDGKKLEEKMLGLLDMISHDASFKFEILGEDKIEDEFLILLREIKIEFFREKQKAMLKLIRDLENKGDEAGVENFLKEFQDLSRIISE
ncbi:MAG: DNA primase [Candidatus Wolfebacteria bacterium]|nr:DNA primase [Candidatus Wolfebacteria bacterium]